MEQGYAKIDRKVEQLIEKVSAYTHFIHPDIIREDILKAYEFWKKAHEWQKRLSWEPYIGHPVEAALILVDLKPDIYTIQACILHDVIEDTPVTHQEIQKIFWDQVEKLCLGMEKLSKVRYKWEDRGIGSLRKMFVAMAEDLRVIFIKLADRLHNMKTLKHHPKKDKRVRIALETLNIYAPIADRLSLFNIKNALEEECFKILDYENYRKIKNELGELKESIDIFSKDAVKEIKDALDEGGIDIYTVDYRVKSIYSIYKKIKKKWLENVQSLYDLFWIRIIVQDIESCYKVLWIIHSFRTPLPNRFKDYIALPKPNGYKSLHTTIIGLLKNYRQQPTEIQIKTFEMKEYSEIGVAAHFEYKERWSKVAKDIDWVKELKEMTESLWNNELITSINIDVFKDRIFVLTPKWDSINLPQWSTPIDFAYSIHSDLWNHIAFAKVNGKIYPLDKELSNWDVLEIITDKSRKPSPFWLSFVKTNRAKDHIKYYLNKDSKEQNRERGREIVNKYLENAWLPQLDKELSLLKIIDGKENDLEDRLSTLEQVWNFWLPPWALIRKIIKSTSQPVPQTEKKHKKWNAEESSVSTGNLEKIEIVIGWEKNLPYKLCACCKKKIPQQIVAHINNKGVIKLHKRDCEVLASVNKERLLSAYITGSEAKPIIAHISFLFQNKIGIFRELSDIIYSMHINIEEINSKKEDEKTTRLSLALQIPDYDYLLIERLIERVKLNLQDKLIEYKVEKVGE